jgi:hypothetical protein
LPAKGLQEIRSLEELSGSYSHIYKGRAEVNKTQNNKRIFAEQFSQIRMGFVKVVKIENYFGPKRLFGMESAEYSSRNLSIR